MAKITRNFTAGKMNKMVDERLIPNGEYVDAFNVRMGSTENSEIGVIENSKGNERLTTLSYNNQNLSSKARCIGAFEDGVNETIYWFIHDRAFTSSPTNKLDMIVSLNVSTQILTYHVISINDGDDENTTLNFNPDYLITGVNKVEDLLFFTDNYNQPRRINVLKNYPNPDVSNVDGFVNEDILVIKSPPVAAPTIQLSNSGGQENFLSERFISFAYRYRYDDDEYSATSQFSSAAFIPNPFSYTQESYLNEGMTNFYNTAQITFNTGGPLVKGIDLLFKDSDSNVVKIIEKIDKANYVDYQDVAYTFRNSKIFTVLPEADILRLYDNVPRLAQAQTIMGNRLMYGNYVEGYDLVDKENNPVRLEFEVDQENTDFDPTEIDATKVNASYTIDGTVNVTDGKAEIDLSEIDLVEGALLSFVFTFEHDSWSGTGTLPTDTNVPPLTLSFGIQLPKFYGTVYEWANSEQFTELIGTVANIQPMATADNGNTITDIYNQQFIGSFSTPALVKYESGISAIRQPINVESFTNNSTIKFTFPAIQYADSATSPTTVFTEYFSLVSASVNYAKQGNGSSLHSNRGYEVGMIYMDEFKRSSTALVSPFNTVHIDCSKSSTRNQLKITIPTTQVAPYWAQSYKLAIKPDKETYDTIFTNIFFSDPLTNDTYFLLEGENAAKITEGQRLIVKADSSGPTNRCIYTTVLEKDAKDSQFWTDLAPVDDEGNPLVGIPGTYMKIKANNFVVSSSENAIVDTTTLSTTAKQSGEYPSIALPVVLNAGVSGGGTNQELYDIPGGSRIEFDLEFERRGYGDGNNACEERKYVFKKTYTSSQDYPSFEAWFRGENIASTLDSGEQTVGGGASPINNVFIEAVNNTTLKPTLEALDTNYYQFCTNDNAGPTLGTSNFLAISGTRACNGAKYNKKLRSTVTGRIIVFRAESTMIFESEPSDALPDVWYESAESFDIVRGTDFAQYNIDLSNLQSTPVTYLYKDINNQDAQITIYPGKGVEFIAKSGTAVRSSETPLDSPSYITLAAVAIEDGTHLGNVSNQNLTTGQAAISDTGFFNCYAFGNGCESYKIRDSVIGKELKLGNRVTTTQEIDYQEVRRFADITYSGIYNDESNVNRLNEFNAGLLNFKPLEESFGPIQKLFGRETDILTLQEDKISYVLTGKNILSDAGTGSLLQSVPEVLGTQVARVEEFGISFNPESFAQWGPDKYFTDAKRGSVIRLVGTSYRDDQLEVVSSYGMRTWFRDLFLSNFETQKLGGFDPYMNEYILSSNNKTIPIPESCVECGITREIKTVGLQTVYTECFDLGTKLSDVSIDWTVVSVQDTFSVSVTYDGTTVSQNNVSTSGSIVINKNKVNVTNVSVKITSSNTGEADLILNVPCPNPVEITVIETCATTPAEAGLTTNNRNRYILGGTISQYQTTAIQFASGSAQPIVTSYNSTSGTVGEGPIPSIGSTVTMQFKNFSSDTAVWKNNYKFKYLVSSTLYPNTPETVNTLLGLATPLTTDTSGSPDEFSGTFTMPSINANEYLYLVYDYREPTLIDLCYDATDSFDACCGCEE